MPSGNKIISIVINIHKNRGNATDPAGCGRLGAVPESEAKRTEEGEELMVLDAEIREEGTRCLQ